MHANNTDTELLVAAPAVEEIVIEEMTEVGGMSTFGTLGSAGCPACFGTSGCFNI
jgi:hypothetical protein